MAGWWLTYPSEKYLSVGIMIPEIWKKKTIQTTNQVGNIKSMGILSQATHFQMSHPALASQAPH